MLLPLQTGANDVANSFATSVGSKTLKLWQAVIIAGIFEFVGAVGLGGETTKTVASKIADVDLYQQFPEIYMYGMLCALTVAGTWLLLATMWCFAVSTTHSITGSIMGFALVYGGWQGVVWFEEKGDFPFCSGFTPIVLSWFFSPIIGGILGSIFFNFSRYVILRRQNSTKLAIYFIPFLIFFTIFINLMFVLAKGAGSEMEKTWPCTKTTGFKGLPSKDCSAKYSACAWIAAAAAGGVGVIAGAISIPLLLRNLKQREEMMESAAANPTTNAETDVEKVAAMADGSAGSESDNKQIQRHESIKVHEVPEDVPWYEAPIHYAKRFSSQTHRQVIKGLFYDVHVGASYNECITNIHNAAEVFNPETERIFSYLQVISACCVAFAHGANDVANAIGPFSAIYTVYRTYAVPGSSSTTPKWIFVMGGIFIVVGLATYGYNIIMTIGVQLLKLTPSRGFSAELAAGMTIALASFFGIPVSTTQIITGSETGVGMSEHLWKGINWVLFAKIFSGWILTIVMAIIFCAALFAAGAYAPSITMSHAIQDYKTGLYSIANVIYGDMSELNLAEESNVNWWTGDAAMISPMPYNGSVLEEVIQDQNETFYSALIDDDQYQLMFPDQAFYYFNEAISLQSQYSTSTIGNTNA
eukprot:363443-Chlamydomonas_euryale.AAC.6